MLNFFLLHFCLEYFLFFYFFLNIFLNFVCNVFLIFFCLNIFIYFFFNILFFLIILFILLPQHVTQHIVHCLLRLTTQALFSSCSLFCCTRASQEDSHMAMRCPHYTFTIIILLYILNCNNVHINVMLNVVEK